MRLGVARDLIYLFGCEKGNEQYIPRNINGENYQKYHRPTAPFGNYKHNVSREHPGPLVTLPGEGDLGSFFPSWLDPYRQLRRRLHQLPGLVQPL